MSGRVHFVGIGGAGMSVIAELLLARGIAVSGSDSRDSATVARLRDQGVTVSIGHVAEAVAGAATVVISTAIRPGNPEVEAARAAGIEVIHRSVALARAAAGMEFVAVAGAHGKTTTSAMLATALLEAGADPSFAIGGTVLSLGTGARLGNGRAFVAEADESDSSFLAYSPRIAVVTNVEADHLDSYGTTAAVEQAFEKFVDRIVPGGLLIACADDAGSARLATAAAGRGLRVLRYGGLDDDHARAAGLAVPAGESPLVRIVGVQLTADGAAASLQHAGGTTALELRVPGLHNLRNATAAWCAGVELGIEPAAMAAGLATFSGTARRFQLRGEVEGIRVIDDYAHHPTEVAEMLGTARRTAGAGRVIVLFQPHLYSRTEAFAGAFASALRQADEVVLTAIYGAREEPRPGVTSELITEHVAGSRYIAEREDAARSVAALAREGDLVITVGAGDVTELADVILAELEARQGA